MLGKFSRKVFITQKLSTSMFNHKTQNAGVFFWRET